MLNFIPQSHTIDDIAREDFDRLSHEIPLKDFSGKTIFITGATGFFGRWLLLLCDWMNKHSTHSIHVIALSRDPEDFLKNYPLFRDFTWLSWVKGDSADFPFFEKPIDYLIHAATDTSVDAAMNPAHLFNSILFGTKRVLELTEKQKISNLLLVSSGAIYGKQESHYPFLTESTPTAPNCLQSSSAYGEGKRVMEFLGHLHSIQSKTKVVTARCFAFAGAGLPLIAHFAIGNFIYDALHKDAIRIKGNGLSIRSYLYAADLAIWLLRLLVTGQSGHAYNVGSDQAVSIADLARTVTKVLSPKMKVIIEGKEISQSEKNLYLPSIIKAREECHLNVWTDLEQAIQRMAMYKN
jgi:dTDP-glucose 4,6-dehydratase